MSNELRNRTVVITGASAGVGRAAAHRFARAGARVAMIARDKDALNDVKNEIERLGGDRFCGAGRCCRFESGFFSSGFNFA
jgi:NADP-dependent 3-hydroxy acid dehydrogenase YdfG